MSFYFQSVQITQVYPTRRFRGIELIMTAKNLPLTFQFCAHRRELYAT